MLFSYEKSDANHDIKKLLDNYSSEYERIKKNAREDYIISQPYGAVIPKEVQLFGKHKEDFEKVVNDTKAGIKDIVDPLRKKLVDEQTAPPSTDAVNTLTLLNMKKNISEQDLNLIMDKYGDNVQVYNTVKDIAERNDIYNYGVHPVEQSINAIDNLLENTNSFSVINAEKGYANSSFMSLIKMNVDDAFPCEEG